VPYRMLSRPPITLWEHKLARKRLREQRRDKIDENSLFAAIDEMREIERNAETMTRTARRNRTRRQAVLTSENPPNQKPTLQEYAGPVSPFEDIEPW